MPVDYRKLDPDREYWEHPERYIIVHVGRDAASGIIFEKATKEAVVGLDWPDREVLERMIEAGVETRRVSWARWHVVPWRRLHL